MPLPSRTSALSLLNHLAKEKVIGEDGPSPSLLNGMNPATFTISDPLRLWILQVTVIVTMCQLLYICVRPFRQPKVIAEVLGGVLLGPTALGRIPGFTNHIFPSASLPYLSLPADIGLCLFLFLIGLEIDVDLVKHNARKSAIVCLAGIALPFGIGSALSMALYYRFVDSSVHLTYFMLFTGVAYSITAFPILCRILTDLGLLDTSVGIIILSAGIGNDVIGWILLALSMALVNSSSGLSALYILLACIAFVVFLLFPVKYAMLWLARKTGSAAGNGPTVSYMTVVMALLWGCAFFTDSIGVNAIFGAFLAGLIVPREGGLTITITERLEDVVTIVLLPLYFTLSGLNTNLGLLNNATAWGFTIAIIVLAFVGKFGGCMLACRATGYGWRESSVVGTMMSCKGLVEIIVLNIGLQAGILSQRIFSMFVFAALVLTFMTVPIVMAIYSPDLRREISETARSTQGGERRQEDDKASIANEEQPWSYRFTVVLDNPDHLPSAMALTQLFLPPQSSSSNVRSTLTPIGSKDKIRIGEVHVEALRLVELSDRTSALMKSFVATDNMIHTDPVLNIFWQTLGEPNDLDIATSLSVVPYDDFACTVTEHAEKHASNLILLPCVPHTALMTPVIGGARSGDGPAAKTSNLKSVCSPLDFALSPESKEDAFPLEIDSSFVRGIFLRSKTDVALFIDTGDRSGTQIGGGFHHVFMPFFGGPDDRLALELVLQLCSNPKITATVVRMVRRDTATAVGETTGRPPMGHLGDKIDASRIQTVPIPCVEGPPVNATMVPESTQGHTVQLQSETADSLTWDKYATPDSSAYNDATPTLRLSLSRIRFSDMHTPTPLHAAVLQARAIQETSSRLLIITGRSRRLAESHRVEMKQLSETYHRSSAALEGMRRTIGDAGTAMMVGNGSASGVVVVQAAHVGND